MARSVRVLVILAMVLTLGAVGRAAAVHDADEGSPRNHPGDSDDRLFEAHLEMLKRGRPAAPDKPSPDEAAMLRLYDAFDHPGHIWRHHSVKGDHPCSWWRVRCDEDARVIDLDFSIDHVPAEIPDAIGELPKLQRVDFLMTKLNDTRDRIRFAGNHMDQLRDLKLGRISFPTSPDDEPMERICRAWWSLDLRWPHSCKQPCGGLWRSPWPGVSCKQIGGQLRVVKLRTHLYAHGSMQDVSPHLGRLTELRRLDIGQNYRLTGSLPTELGNLKHLDHLYLTANSLKGPIPDEWKGCEKLAHIEMTGNELTEPVPDWLLRRRLHDHTRAHLIELDQEVRKRIGATHTDL